MSFICSFAACLGHWCSTRIPVSDMGCLSGCAQRCSDDLIIHATRTAAFFLVLFSKLNGYPVSMVGLFHNKTNIIKH